MSLIPDVFCTHEMGCDTLAKDSHAYNEKEEHIMHRNQEKLPSGSVCRAMV